MCRLATLILHISACFPGLTIAAPQFFASPQKMAFAAEESQEGNVVLYTVVGLYLALLTAARTPSGFITWSSLSLFPQNVTLCRLKTK